MPAHLLPAGSESPQDPLNYDVSKENLEAARGEFDALLGVEYVLCDAESCRVRSSTPWSPATHSERSNLVVMPGCTSDVSEIMKICSRRKIPAIGYSGGTSFSGALTATRNGICIDFRRMDRILHVHKEDMDVVVQPAVGWQDLNRELESYGLFFPPDPGPGAKIGGMVRFDCHPTALPSLRLTDLDCDELFRHECLSLWHDERLGNFNDCCSCGRHHCQNEKSPA